MNRNPVLQFLVRFFGGLFRLLGRATNAILEAFWDDVFRPLLRRVAGSWITWALLVAMVLGWVQKHPGSQASALVNQTLQQGCSGVDALLPTVVIGVLLFGGLGMINPFRRRGGRGHDRHGRGRH